MVVELNVEAHVREMVAAEFVRGDSVDDEMPMAAEMGVLYL